VVSLETTAATVGGVLEIDQLIFFDAHAAQVIALVGPGDSEPATDYLAGTLTIDHGLGNLRTPKVDIGGAPIGYAGDVVFATKAPQVYGALLVTGGGTASANGDIWRQADPITNNLFQNTWTFTRTNGYLVPA
jgi:hypothetical protein